MRKLFAAFLVAFILLGGDLIWRAWAQTNTFCASNLSCNVSALWNFTGGLQNNGVAVPVLPINLATQVTGTLPGTNYAQVNLAASGNGGVGGVLPGANMAATNLAGGNNPGGVTGVLPLANLTTQGTDTNLLTSGTVSASTGVPLCTDANHGATTSGCAASGVTESVISTGNGAQSTNLVCAAANQASGCQWWFWANAHTITRLIINVSTAPSGCSTNAVFGVKDVTSSTVLASLTPTATGITDSGALSVSTTAGHQFVIGLTTATAGCTTTIVANSMGVTYQ